MILSGRPGEDHRNGHDRSTPKGVRALENKNKNWITFYTLVLDLPNVKHRVLYYKPQKSVLLTLFKKKKKVRLCTSL